MILTEVFGNVDSIEHLDHYHVETALVKSDDLTKRILRVVSDHGVEYGIRLEDPEVKLQNGSAFKVGHHKLLVLSVIPDRVIVIVPTDIDQMGELAHFVGNMHKPVHIENGEITLLYDPVVEQALKDKQVDYRVEKSQLAEPLRHVDMTGYGAAHDASHAAMEAHQHHHHHHHDHDHYHDNPEKHEQDEEPAQVASEEPKEPRDHHHEHGHKHDDDHSHGHDHPEHAGHRHGREHGPREEELEHAQHREGQ